MLPLLASLHVLSSSTPTGQMFDEPPLFPKKEGLHCLAAGIPVDLHEKLWGSRVFCHPIGFRFLLSQCKVVKISHGHLGQFTALYCHTPCLVPQTLVWSWRPGETDLVPVYLGR